MLRKATAACREAISITRHENRLRFAKSPETPRAWVGCSHWTTPFRPSRYFASGPNARQSNAPKSVEDNAEPTSVSLEKHKGWSDEGLKGTELMIDGIVIDQVTVTPDESGSSSTTPSKTRSKDNRPTLPTSIKKLNRLLSHDRSISIPESDLIETFVRGRGPGGQAINKTNSSVSLIHIPSGIRVQSQPTRSREENRKIARKIMAERLDLIRARATSERGEEHSSTQGSTLSGEEEDGINDPPKVLTRKEKEKQLAGQWSRDEIRWEKERRRKLNQAKKTKKKRKITAGESQEEKVRDV